MNRALLTRLQKLEQSQGQRTRRVWQVYMRRGETDAQALARANIQPHDEDLVIFHQWFVTPTTRPERR